MPWCVLQGNCSADLPLPPIPGSLGFNVTPGQCVLYARSDLFTVLSTQIWIHRLYLRISFPTTTAMDDTRRWIFASMISIPLSADTPQGERYVTEVTCEGDGLGPGGGIWADSDVYVGGVPLLLPGARSEHHPPPPLRHAPPARVSLPAAPHHHAAPHCARPASQSSAWTPRPSECAVATAV